MQTPAVKERVARVSAEEIAPALQMDATYLELLEVVEGVARIRLKGGCGSCPTSIMAIVMGIEQELRRHVPEVQYIEITS
jgi:Fe-S cluster biogenesis protein NfuA